MSFFSSISSALKSAASPILGAIGGQIAGSTGAAVGSVIGTGIASTVATPIVAPMAIGLPPAIPSMSSSMFPAAIPALGSVARAVLPGVGLTLGGSAVRSIGRVAIGGAKRVYNAAAGYCRKHPQWCSTIGGIAAVEAMIGRGELPIPKRRRGRGISATELKHFRRVAKFTSRYCAPTKRAMKAPVMRGKSCR